MKYQAKKLSQKEIAYQIEEFLLDLPGDLLKIYLYIFKAGIYEQTFTEEEIADRLDTTISKVHSVLQQCQSKNLLSIHTEEIMEEKSDEELQLFFYFYKLYKGSDLELSEIADITEMYSKHSIDSDYFSFIVEYCDSKNKLNSSYMKKVLEDWISKGIMNRTQAEGFVYQQNETVQRVKKAFAIHSRSLAPIEMAYILSWKSSPDLIEYACEKTILYTGKANFRYADTILSQWKEKNITTVEAAQKDSLIDSSKDNKKTIKNSFHNFDQRDYDYDELERQLLLKYSE